MAKKKIKFEPEAQDDDSPEIDFEEEEIEDEESAWNKFWAGLSQKKRGKRDSRRHH